MTEVLQNMLDFQFFCLLNGKVTSIDSVWTVNHILILDPLGHGAFFNDYNREEKVNMLTSGGRYPI